MKTLGWLLSIAAISSLSLPLVAQKVIPLAKGMSDLKEIALSSVARSIDYIPLETTSESLLGQDILDVTPAGNYLFVCDYNYVFQFTPEGKFIRKIGKKGQGPGEYLDILSIAYNEPQKEIYLTDFRAGQVHVYSFEGNYLRDVKTEQGSLTPYVDTSGNLYAVSNAYLRSKDKTSKELFVYAPDGKLSHAFSFHFKEGETYPRLIFSFAIIYPFKGGIYYKNPLETVVYQIEGGTKTPVYDFDLSQYGKLKGEDDAILETRKDIGTNLPNKDAEKKIHIISILETDHNLGIHYAQEDVRCFAWLDKQSGKLCRLHAPNADRDGFVDDLEGGYPVFPQYHKANKLISVIPAATLQEKVKPATAKGSLKSALQNLQEDDNQVLQIVALK